jgi:hypothetical protein
VPELVFIVGAYVSFALVVFGVRRATASIRQRWRFDPGAHARCGRGFRASMRSTVRRSPRSAYILFEQWCDFGTTQDYLAVALVWAGMRWWIVMWGVVALLRASDRSCAWSR